MLKIKIPSLKNSAGGVARRDLIPAINGLNVYNKTVT
jgi:hypothetical protein